ncbi:hypothetical protein GWI33_016193 [Rhynchophorus ferrugineus]|uniref:Uncharacterized protein n=1 Tax=Rhynchophorus ferrugineus TaxID=354439 RepID=A0A834I295_RHYFE|nr:hypothetical protein GWI33_016193 [Rhynchophorus ferrugineus]
MTVTVSRYYFLENYSYWYDNPFSAIGFFIFRVAEKSKVFGRRISADLIADLERYFRLAAETRNNFSEQTGRKNGQFHRYSKKESNVDASSETKVIGRSW